MNKEYVYIDGKVIICDENNNKTQSEYYDNLDKVLVQENIIETIDNRIKELENKKNSFKGNKKHYIPIVLPMTVIMTIVAFPIYLNFFANNSMLVTLMSSITSICFLPLGAGIEFQMYKEYRDDVRKQKGIKSELSYLKGQIEKEKDYLQDLKNDRSKDNEKTDFRTVEVDDTQQLKSLDDKSDLYYGLGYNVEKYYKYYEKGSLETKLQKKHYNDEEIRLAKDFIEEEGPTLVLRRKYNKYNN